MLVAETFERGGELLKQFSEEQLEQGFWYLVGESSPGDFMGALTDTELPAQVRLRVLRSFVPLFEQVMALRCSPHLSQLAEGGVNPLNSACYMWWDLLRFNLWLGQPEPGEFDDEIIATLQRLLKIPHDACRESALHGIGHLCKERPTRREELSGIVDEFLARTPELRPELRAYAERSKIGDVL